MPRSRSAASPAASSERSPRGSASTCACSSRSSRVVSAAIGLTWSRRFLGADADALGSSEPVFVRPPRRLLALGALAFACLLIEGASADWSAVYLRDELGTTAAIAAIGFTAFSITMTLGRDLRRSPGRSLRPRGRRPRRRRPRRRRLRPVAPGRRAGARDRRLRVPRRGDVGRRADRLPRRGARAGHVRRRRARRRVEHRLPRLPRRAADHRRAGRARRAARRARRGRPPRRHRRAAGAAPPATRAPGAAVAREPQTVAA